MSINRIDFPNPAPISITDWEDIINVAEFLSLGVGNPVDYDFSSNTIKQGVQIMIGGSVYQSTTATAITGTPSDYVQITPAGATASAAYVASLAGVSWNSVYNHYEDGGGNAYLFNEAKAELVSPKTVVGKFAEDAHIGTLTTRGQTVLASDSGGVVLNGVVDVKRSTAPLIRFNDTAGSYTDTPQLRSPSDGRLGISDSGGAMGFLVDVINNSIMIGTTLFSGPRAIIVDAEGALPSIASQTVLLLQRNSGAAVGAEASLIAGTTANAIWNFGDADKEDQGQVRYNNTDDEMSLFSNGLEFLRGTSDQSVIINTTLFVDTIAEKTASTGVSVQAQSGEQLLTKVIPIGAWDMDADDSLAVAHGIANLEKINSINVQIYVDSGFATIYSLDFLSAGVQQGGLGTTTSTNVQMQRLAGGFFDTTAFNDIGINRGKITIEYEV